MFTNWGTTIARLSARAASRAQAAGPAPAPRRCLDCIELEDRVLLSAAPAAAINASAPAPSTAAAQYAALPLGFEPNQGQAASGVDFIAHGNGYQVALEQGNAAIQLSGAGGTQQLELNLLGANAGAAATAESLESGRSNYLLGSDPSKWITGVSQYGEVDYKQIYSGIGVQYYGNGQQLEYNFSVAPGADAGQIHLQFAGSQSLSVDAAGDLVVALAGGGNLIFKAPVAYQDTATGIEPVASSYQILPDGTVTFALGNYDHSQTLVIDPLLDYGTYLGGSGQDQVNAIAVDASGDVFLAGQTNSSNFPITAGAYQTSWSGPQMGFVSELNPTGTALIYSTYFGGSTGNTAINGLALDSVGKAYFTGDTSSTNLPIAKGFQTSNAGGQDGFVGELNPAGSNLIYSSYFGGPGNDSGNGIALTSSGLVYVVGQVQLSTTYSVLGLTGLANSSDAFVMEVDPTKLASSSLLYDTAFQGSNQSTATAVAVDTSGQAYIGGYSQTGFPTTSNAYNSTFSGGTDGFLAVMNSSHTVTYSTYLQSSGTSVVNGLAVNSSGDVFLTGSTNGGLPVTSGAYQSSYGGGGHDAFVTEFDPTKSHAASLLYSSYLGGNGDDQGLAIAIDSNGRIDVVGSTNGSYSISADAYQLANGGGHDGFLAVASLDGSYYYATYLGGSGEDIATAVAADAAGGVYVGGYTASADFNEATPGSYDPTRPSGGSSGFALKFTTPVGNTAPTLSGANSLSGIVEGATGNSGTLVSALVAGQISDPDPGAVQGIAVTAVDNTNGTWQYSPDNGHTWIAFGSPSSTAAVLLPAIAGSLVRFVPNQYFFGTSGITFVAWDRTSGTIDGTADVTTAGGSTAFSTASASSSIVVTHVNQAPVGTNNTVTLLENTSYTFKASDFGFSDPHDPPPYTNNLLAVKLSGVPDHGTLTDNGVAVANNQYVSVSDINAGLLVYTPAQYGNGSNYANFHFQVQDDGGTANGGQDTDPNGKTMTINVTWVNQAPAGQDNTVSMWENTSYTFKTSDFGFSDPNDHPANALLAVKIDALPTSGTLADNGIAVTSGQYVSASDIGGNLLKFTPAAHTYAANYANFTFQVQDNGGTANGGHDSDPTANTMTMSVNWVNQAPTGQNNTVTTLENHAYTFQVADFGFSDPNDSPPNALANIKITLTATGGTLTDHGGTINAGHTTNVSASDISSGLLVFTPASGASGTNYASLSFQVQDNGGTANGGQNTDPTAKTMTINVLRVNQAPTGQSNTITLLENTTYTFQAADFGFSDPNDSPSNSLLAVKIDALPTAGTFTDNGVAVTSGQYVSASEISSGLLKFTPTTYSSGTSYANFTFQVQDNGGTANGGQDTDPTPKTMTMSVTWVNQAPMSQNNTVTTLENTPYTFQTGDFGFSDPHDSPPNSLLAVKIDNLPVAGSLTDGGLSVTSGQFVSAADINAGLLRFTPTMYTNGVAYANFTFQVQDNGGTANGGQNTDPTAKTMTVNVTPVNQAPTGISTNVTTLENTTYTFQAADFGFSDPHDSPPNNLLAVKIDNLPAGGSLTDGGVSVTSGQFVSAADINAGLLQFTPVAYGNGAAYASFTFQVQDNGGTTNAGQDTDPTAKAMTINVTWVNSPPVGTDNAVAAPEFIGHTFVSSDFGFTDPHDSPPNAMLAVKIDTLPTGGSLTDNGVAVVAGQSVAATDISAGLLNYTPPNYSGGHGSDSFTFQVQDNGGTANGGQDTDPTPRTIALVTTINNPPTGANATVATPENTPYTFQTANFGFSDPNNSPPDALLAVKISALPAAGTLVDNGAAVAAGQFVSATDIAAGMLKFMPTTNTIGAAYASFTFQVQDNGGTANGGQDVDPSPKSMTIDVNPVAYAPVLSGANSLTAIQVNQVNNAGTSVAALLAGQVSELNATPGFGIAVVAADNTSGTWQYSLNGGQTWQSIGAPSQNAALLLPDSPAALVRFVPATDFSGTVSGGLVFRAWNQTSGVAGGTADVAVNGGTTAFSAATAATGVTVNLVNPTILTPQSMTSTTTTVASTSESSGDKHNLLVAGLASFVPAPTAASAPTTVAASSSAAHVVVTEIAVQSQPASSPHQATISASSFEAAAMVPVTTSAPARPGANAVRSTAQAGVAAGLLWTDLDNFKQQVRSAIQPDVLSIGSALTVSSGLTVGYVIWMLRGGMLLSSLMAQMPAWRLVDPLVVLNRFEELDELDGEHQESLPSLLETAGVAGADPEMS